MTTRELDLGRTLQQVGRRITEEGQTVSQRFHDWKRVEKLPVGRGSCPDCAGEGYRYNGTQVMCDMCKGTGDYNPGGNGRGDGQQDQQAARLAVEWTKVRLQLEHYATRAEWLMDQAKGTADKALRRDWTPAQAEAEGWCGHCFKVAGALVPITLRPSGEPYYRGRCRFDGAWPGGDPPADVVKARLAGKAVLVRAS